MSERYIHRDNSQKRETRANSWPAFARGEEGEEEGRRSHSTSNYVITSELTRGWARGNLPGQSTRNRAEAFSGVDRGMASTPPFRTDRRKI